ncbi:MAG: hypothetical protein ACK56I_37425, partial [bacterium]
RQPFARRLAAAGRGDRHPAADGNDLLAGDQFGRERQRHRVAVGVEPALLEEGIEVRLDRAAERLVGSRSRRVAHEVSQVGPGDRVAGRAGVEGRVVEGERRRDRARP